jgi:hypothetical protein
LRLVNSKSHPAWFRARGLEIGVRALGSASWGESLDSEQFRFSPRTG